MMKICPVCLTKMPAYVNYCSWECAVKLAKKAGGKTIAPNNLPIRCIRYDNTMLEHEHADHPSYMFPIEVEHVAKIENIDKEWDDSFNNETHALIYSDGWVALTVYEHTYHIWSLATGAGLSLRNKDWRLTKDSLAKVLG